jgi:hypothetical protein
MCAALSEEKDPDKRNIYLDISKKPASEDVLLFLLKTFAAHFNYSHEDIVEKIQKYSIHLGKNKISNLEEYQRILEEYIEKRQQELPDKNVKDIVLTDEGIEYFGIMENLLEEQKKQMVFLLFDHIDTLSREEQQRVNLLIHSR